MGTVRPTVIIQQHGDMRSKLSTECRATRGLAIYLAFPFTLHKRDNVKLYITRLGLNRFAVV